MQHISFYTKGSSGHNTPKMGGGYMVRYKGKGKKPLKLTLFSEADTKDYLPEEVEDSRQIGSNLFNPEQSPLDTFETADNLVEHVSEISQDDNSLTLNILVNSQGTCMSLSAERYLPHFDGIFQSNKLNLEFLSDFLARRTDVITHLGNDVSIIKETGQRFVDQNRSLIERLGHNQRLDLSNPFITDLVSQGVNPVYIPYMLREHTPELCRKLALSDGDLVQSMCYASSKFQYPWELTSGVIDLFRRLYVQAFSIDVHGPTSSSLVVDRIDQCTGKFFPPKFILDGLWCGDCLSPKHREENLRLRSPEKVPRAGNGLLYLAQFTMPGGEMAWKFGRSGGGLKDMHNRLKEVRSATGYVEYINILDIKRLLNVNNLPNVSCWFVEQCFWHRFGNFAFIPKRPNSSPTEWYTLDLPIAEALSYVEIVYMTVLVPYKNDLPGCLLEMIQFHPLEDLILPQRSPDAKMTGAMDKTHLKEYRQVEKEQNQILAEAQVERLKKLKKQYGCTHGRHLSQPGIKSVFAINSNIEKFCFDILKPHTDFLNLNRHVKNSTSPVQVKQNPETGIFYAVDQKTDTFLYAVAQPSESNAFDSVFQKRQISLPVANPEGLSAMEIASLTRTLGQMELTIKNNQPNEVQKANEVDLSLVIQKTQLIDNKQQSVGQRSKTTVTINPELESGYECVVLTEEVLIEGLRLGEEIIDTHYSYNLNAAQIEAEGAYQAQIEANNYRIQQLKEFQIQLRLQRLMDLPISEEWSLQHVQPIDLMGGFFMSAKLMTSVFYHPHLVLLASSLLLAKDEEGNKLRLPDTIKWLSKDDMKKIACELEKVRDDFMLNLSASFFMSFTSVSLSVILNQLKTISLNYNTDDDLSIVVLVMVLVFMLINNKEFIGFSLLNRLISDRYALIGACVRFISILLIGRAAFDQHMLHFYFFSLLESQVSYFLVNWLVQKWINYAFAFLTVISSCFIPLTFKLADGDLWHNHLE
jgi:hypothetical protein